MRRPATPGWVDETLRIWRQADAAATGAMRIYRLDDVSPDMSFLEMLDVLNEQLNAHR